MNVFIEKILRGAFRYFRCAQYDKEWLMFTLNVKVKRLTFTKPIIHYPFATISYQNTEGGNFVRQFVNFAT
jgi:hypothetical protein